MSVDGKGALSGIELVKMSPLNWVSSLANWVGAELAYWFRGASGHKALPDFSNFFELVRTTCWCQRERARTGELSAYATDVMRATVGEPGADDRAFKGWLRRRDKHVENSRCGRNGDQSFSGIGLPSVQISSYLPPSNPEQIPGSGMGW
jgi:hypothetical protein